MKYFLLDPLTTTLNISDKRGRKKYSVPVEPRHPALLDHPLTDIILYEVFYRNLEAKESKSGRIVKYRLSPPDPWVVSLGILIWEGIIQGLSWKLIDAAISRAYKMISSKEHKDIMSTTEIKLSFKQYKKKELRKHFYLELKRYNEEISKPSNKKIKQKEAPKIKCHKISNRRLSK